MIQKIRYNTRINETETLSSTIVSRCEKCDLTGDLIFQNILADAKTKVANLSKAINRMKVMSDLEILNEDRKETLRALYYLIRAGIYDDDADLAAAAQFIFEIVMRNGGLGANRGGYKETTADIKSMLTDLAEAKALENIAKLAGVDTRIAALQAKQDQFVTGYESLEVSKAMEGLTSNATMYKDETIEVINKRLIPHLNNFCEYLPDVYGNLAEEIDQLITDSNTIVKRRSKKSEVADTEAETTPSDDPSTEE